MLTMPKVVIEGRERKSPKTASYVLRPDSDYQSVRKTSQSAIISHPLYGPVLTLSKSGPLGKNTAHHLFTVMTAII